MPANTVANNVLHTGWLKKESSGQPGSFAKRYVLLQRGLKLLCYKDQSLEDCRSTIELDGDTVTVCAKDGCVVIEGCCDSGRPASVVVLKGTEAEVQEWVRKIVGAGAALGSTARRPPSGTRRRTTRKQRAERTPPRMPTAVAEEKAHPEQPAESSGAAEPQSAQSERLRRLLLPE